MKNILLIIPYGSVGGMERLALTFYDYYKTLGYGVKAVKIVKLRNDIINFGGDEFFLSDKDLNEFSFQGRLKFYLKIPGMLRKIIKQEKISHSIAFGDMANVFSSLTFTNEFKIASIHALKSVEFLNDTFLNKIFKLSFKTSYRNFDKVVCISEAIKKDLIANCGFRFVSKLQVIYNPHDVTELNRLSVMPLDFPKEEEWFSKPVIVFVGRLSMQKSPWHLINAFAIFLKNGYDAHLLFIGDGDPAVENHIRNQIQLLQIGSSVFFAGRKSNPYKYLKKSKLLALSSYYEGTPNVIVEAIAVGVPVVSSLCTDGILELMSLEKLDDNGGKIYTETGIITANFFKGSLAIPESAAFTPEEKMMASAFEEIFQDNRYSENLVANQKNILRKFNLDQVANDYLSPLLAGAAK